MNDFEEIDALGKDLNDSSRKVKRIGKQLLVPRKFDDNGEILDSSTFDASVHLKRLDLNDLRFLKVWRDNSWNTAKAQEVSGLTDPQVKRLVSRLAVFREEDARVKALSEIPTTAWITAKHVENVYDGGKLEDSERDSLKELAKISGSYKNTSTVNIQNNVFNMPRLTPEAEARLKEFADAQADVVETDLVS